MAYKDQTTRDMNRRLLNFQKSDINTVLPQYFQDEFPNLITLFEKYYQWMDSDGQPVDQIRQMYANRDATQVPTDLLQYIEDELLLGNSYFGGFQNKREAIKFSNTLYRSKGTKYSIEQFFRGFFGIDPQIVYTKEKIFRVGPEIDNELSTTNDAGEQIKQEASQIGPESQKYLTDDKLYQQLAMLIRSDVSIQKWLDVYKLFVHPAGVYLGSEILLVSQNETGLTTIQDEIGELIPESVSIAGEAALASINPYTYTTLLRDSDGSIVRQSDIQFMEAYAEATVEEMASGYKLIQDTSTGIGLIGPNSPTLDDSDTGGTIRDYPSMSDSALEDSSGLTIGSTLRLDQHKYSTQYDSDG